MKRILGISLLLGLGMGCTNSVQQVTALSANSEQPDQTGDSVSLSYLDTAGLRVTLFAAKMRVFQFRAKEPRTELDSGVHVTFYTLEGNPQAELFAHKAIRFPSGKKTRAQGQVLLVNKRGEQLETEELSWDEASGQIFTEAPVKITRKEEVLFGNGLTGNSDFSKYEMKNITGRVKLNL